MSQPAQDEASAALHNAVDNYGSRVLDNPSMLSNILTDLLPDAPLERNLIIAAAQGGSVALIRQYISDQQMEPDAAVRLAASALAARTGIDAAKCAWVVALYARVLGHAVSTPSVPLPSPVGPPPVPQPSPMGPPPVPQPSPMGPPPVPQPSPQPSPVGPPRDAAPGWSHPQHTPPYGQPTQPTGGQAGFPQLPPPSPPPGQPPSGPMQGPYGPRPAPRSRTGLIVGLIAGAAAVVLVIGYIGVAATTHLPPFSASSPTPPPPSPVPTTPVPTPTGPLALSQIMPGDAPPSSCTDKTASNDNKGIKTQLNCTTNDTARIDLIALQYDTPENYQSSLLNVNNNNQYSTSQSNGCPPSGNGQGRSDWWSMTNPAFGKDKNSGQVIECFYAQKYNTYNYIYTFPTANAFIWAYTSAGWTVLHNWWDGFGHEPKPGPTAGA